MREDRAMENIQLLKGMKLGGRRGRRQESLISNYDSVHMVSHCYGDKWSDASLEKWCK